MDSQLPQDVQRIILNSANIPIDTFLYFQKQLDLVPKRLSFPTELSEKLNKQYERRVKYYKTMIKFEQDDPHLSSPLDYFNKNIDNEYSVEIMVAYDKDDNKMKIAMRIHQTNEEDTEMGTVRKMVADLNNGEFVEDFYDDSDDDAY
jgi:hypothetical protein